jgi:predicted nucleic acid-binding protein
MKTAVTIPDDVFQEAQELAAALGLSLNDLYIAAIAQVINEHSDQSITERLNQVYEKNDSSLEDVIERMQAVSLPVEQW